MSEKRFTLTDWHEVKDNGRIMTVNEVIDKLNAFDDYSKQLQIQIDNLKQEPSQKDWYALVQQSGEISKQNLELWERIGELEKENKQLQKTITKLPPKIKEVWLDD